MLLLLLCLLPLMLVLLLVLLLRQQHMAPAELCAASWPSCRPCWETCATAAAAAAAAAAASIALFAAVLYAYLHVGNCWCAACAVLWLVQHQQLQLPCQATGCCHPAESVVEFLDVNLHLSA
jgi:hypothetical protein